MLLNSDLSPLDALGAVLILAGFVVAIALFRVGYDESKKAIRRKNLGDSQNSTPSIAETIINVKDVVRKMPLNDYKRCIYDIDKLLLGSAKHTMTELELFKRELIEAEDGVNNVFRSKDDVEMLEVTIDGKVMKFPNILAAERPKTSPFEGIAKMGSAMGRRNHAKQKKNELEQLMFGIDLNKIFRFFNPTAQDITESDTVEFIDLIKLENLKPLTILIEKIEHSSLVGNLTDLELVRLKRYMMSKLL